MKTIFYCLLLIPFISQSQITGIGPFQINTATFRMIDSISSSAKVAVKEAFNIKGVPYASMQINKTTHIVLLVPDPASAETNTTDNTYRQRGIRSVYINYVKAGGMDLHNIYLLFKNDILVGLESDGSKDLEDLFKAKYGNPKVRVSTNSEYCEYEATRGYVDDISEWSEWETKDRDISAKMLYMQHYDFQCKKVFSRQLYLKNLRVVDKIIQDEVFAK